MIEPLVPRSVAVDATSLLAPPTGIGVFTREVLAGLAELAGRAPEPVRPGPRGESPGGTSVGGTGGGGGGAFAPVAFAVSWRGRSGLPAAVPSGVRVRSRPMPARLARAAWTRSDRPSVRDLVGPVDVVHGPNFVVPPGAGAAEVVTVHDLTAVRYPELCTPDVLQWPVLLRRALDRGAWVHTVSEAVAAEVRDAFAVDPDRVVAIPNGVRTPPPATPATSGLRGQHLAGGVRYVLAVGTVEPRKDLPGLVAAFDELAGDDADLRLVIAGPDGWGAADLTAAVDRCAHGRRVVRLGWVDDAQRQALLRGAAAVAYPSRYEGFGLVPLEAMAVGTPVVATAVGALPEVVGDAALLVGAGDVAALAGALAAVLGDGELRAELVAKGHERVAVHPWEATVRGLVALYERALLARS